MLQGLILSPMLLLVIIIVAFILIFILSGIRVLAEYERAVIFRLGRALPGVKGPGIIYVIPIIDKMVKVDLREHFFEIPRQRCITKDNAPVDVDVLIYYKVVDARDSVIKVRNFRDAAVGIAQTTLRSVIGDIVLDDVLAKREYINQVLREKLDEITGRWGVKITLVEIREIEPPAKVSEAMIRQMESERIRRAMVTEADGKRESAIKVAEGEKQAAILKAEGERQAAILKAEGEKEAMILKAEGFAIALEKIFNVAKNLDEKTMALQYLETLKALGSSPSTKFIFPVEFLSLISPLREFLQSATPTAESTSKGSSGE
ncbi:MAG: SPFH domain-containing protein [Candidatus Baldrarchaeia archaeon]